MKQLQPVVWTKGTFLTPQHLQIQDRFLEDVLQFRLQALNFQPWGFTKLTIDEETLADGTFALSAASGIFPDGLLFDMPDADPLPASREFADFFEPDQASLDVYLTIPDYRKSGVNVSLTPENGSRYLADVTMVRDENTGASEKPVQVARKNFRLLLEGESREGMSVLRVAQVERTAAKTYRLNGQFVPPLLNYATSTFVSGLLRGIVELLSAKSSILSGTRRQKNQSLADFTAADIANFWLLYTVNSHFPWFNHLFNSEKGHPEELYAAMISLAGALTTFSLKIHPRDIPEYNHDELGKCFYDLEQQLRLLLETVVPSNFVSLPLKLTQPSIYATALADDKYLTNTRMYLAVSAQVPEAEIIKRVPQLLKVCSATHIETLVKQALPGVPLIHMPNPPSAIPVKLQYQYFSLTQSGGAWEAVVRARNLAAYVPSDILNPQMELLILLPQAE